MKRTSWRPWLALAAAATVFAAAPQRRAPGEPAVTVIAYGDTRFTDPSNTTATSPEARRVLVARIADERPDAVLISGDLPWHGGVAADYDVFRAETEIWRRKRLRILPALGNHEFAQGTSADCLEHWWTAFPELRGKRWYAGDIGTFVRSFSLDTMSPLVPGSEQRRWLEHELATLPPRIRFVLIALHHPPVADVQTRLRIDHNPRPNEIALKEYLAEATRSTAARFVVIAGHIHNYERFLEDDVVYLVSGGGGAVPYEVDRTQPDLYQRNEFPNYHYLKLTITAGMLNGEMYRLDEPSAPRPHFTVKDRFSCAVAR